MVDDEAGIRMLVVEVLQELGYAVLEAEDGPRALAILQSENSIDFMITDVGLPGGINGRQLADTAQLHRPNLKVLFITGYADSSVIRKGVLGPGMHIMTKPFNLKELTSRVRVILSESDERPH
ncbi:MAG TPA: response regulator [Stellaceae bacterium]|nr:response regulator [Stellaceae bacterium]